METSEKMFHITQLGNRGGYIHGISAKQTEMQNFYHRHAFWEIHALSRAHDR